MRTLIVFSLMCFSLLASAQTIDRVKLTDADLGCQQIYGEIGDMDKILGIAKDERDTSGTAASAAGMTQQATGVAAQAAMMGGNMGAVVGIAQAAPFLGLFGSAAKSYAENKQKDSAERMGEAKARKEHLTGLFVSKGCKLADVKPPAATPAAPAEATR
jgi:hypothetical protein